MRARTVAIALGIALTAPPTWAQDEPSGPPPEDDLPAEEAPVRLSDDAPSRGEGEYGGVKPGVLPRDGGKPIKGAKPGTLTWVGFQDEGGVARIFIQSRGEFSYSQRVEGRTVVVHLEGIKRLAPNARRPVDTRFFDTPVARITVKKVGKRKARKGQPARKAGYEVRIALKNGETAREAAARTATEADGMFYLYLDVGPSAGGAAPAATPQ